MIIVELIGKCLLEALTLCYCLFRLKFWAYEMPVYLACRSTQKCGTAVKRVGFQWVVLEVNHYSGILLDK